MTGRWSCDIKLLAEYYIHRPRPMAENKTDEATDELRFAVDHPLEPWDAVEPAFYLGEALRTAQKPDEAAGAYRKVLDLQGCGIYHDMAEKALAELGQQPGQGEQVAPADSGQASGS